MTDATEISELKNDNTKEEIYLKIEEDLIFAASNLPVDQTEVGRATKGAAQAYLARLYIYWEKWDSALEYCNKVIDSGKYDLNNSYYDNFSIDNTAESIFAVQYSLDGSDGDTNGNLNERLVWVKPYGTELDFFKPSQNLVNAFATDANGLPLSDGTITDITQQVDPRLDIVVGRPGIPFLDVGICDDAWSRTPGSYGYYIFKKRVPPFNSGQFNSSYPRATSLNYDIIRYAEVLLLKAEALIENNDLGGAMTLINEIRNRANNYHLKNEDGSADASNYLVGKYTSFASKSEAFNALMIERRLEFSHEGNRFFDLVRWGIVSEIMNNYYRSEQALRPYLSNAVFTQERNEYLPIPQTEIDISGGTLTQNY
ncbi:MAG: hypothetical protein COC06_12505 [Bacteroidales bacterium]|nr:MAG: hypothetical protein COC06_12505 [Bacteroidales bacterium]